MSIKYVPTNPPSSAEDLAAYIGRELSNVSETIDNISDGHFDVSNVEPDRPRTGDIRYADGTDWNPGEGEGIYTYLSTGVWSKL